jgi:hypothetical protein
MINKNLAKYSSQRKTIVKELFIVVVIKLLLIFTLWKLCFSGDHRVRVNRSMQEQRLLGSYNF